MDIGDPQETIIVEPLENPVPAKEPAPMRDPTPGHEWRRYRYRLKQRGGVRVPLLDLAILGALPG